jgi:3-hydroxypropanoate dehydrogenase
LPSITRTDGNQHNFANCDDASDEPFLDTEGVFAMSDRRLVSPRRKTIDAAALAQLFTEARTHNGFLDVSVPDRLLREAVDLAKMGPTSANMSPLRVVFLRSEAAKERLRPALAPGNLEKTLAAPVVAVTAYDRKFYEHLPFLFPHADAKAWFEGNEAFANESAFRNGTLQVAYLILALRAVGLDAGPMSGFDNAKVDAEFFPEGRFKSNVLINIGYGDEAKLFPRSPRFSFDQIASIL